MPLEINLSEPREKIIREISAYAGRQLIVRSRDPFLAQIDQVKFFDNTILISGTLLAVLADEPMLAPDILDRILNKTFELSASWDISVAGHGSFYANYVTWGVFYDERLNAEISRIYGLHGTAPVLAERATRLIDTWYRHRNALIESYYADVPKRRT